jgi:hypothetical protein
VDVHVPQAGNQKLSGFHNHAVGWLRSQWEASGFDRLNPTVANYDPHVAADGAGLDIDDVDVVENQRARIWMRHTTRLLRVRPRGSKHQRAKENC